MNRPSLISVEQASRFYRNWLNGDREKRRQQLDAIIKRPLIETDFTALLKQETDAGFPLQRAMRRLRNLVICAIINRDISGKADLSEIVETMTLFAEFTVQILLESLYKEMMDAHGMPIGAQSGKRQEVIVLGMGKLGGRELNVSSDIDLIFVYPENGETVPTHEGRQRLLSNQEFFIRLGRRLIAAISEIEENGFIFRVDMALRPNGNSGPLAVSFSMVEQYFIVQGREWERYAWIKARAITGNSEDIATLRTIAFPFVYRKYLDFGVIESIRSLHQQIRADVIRRERMHPEHSNDVKLGRGGIREIEFLAQMFQLIRGGREPALQDKSTRNILRILAEKRLMEEETVVHLLESYTFLRNIEHRIQYLEDAQSHSLPNNAEDRLLIAQSAGFLSIEDLMEALKTHRDFVSEQFDAIFGEKTDPQDPDKMVIPPLISNQSDEDQLHILRSKFESMGFPEADTAAKRLQAFWKSHRIQALSDTNSNRLAALINSVLSGILEYAHKPLVTLERLLDFLESIARRTSYLSLLMEYPVATSRLVHMLDTSDWAAQYLTRHPILLDELLDARTLMERPDWEAFTKDLDTQLEPHRGDTEQLMDTLREIHHAQQFRLLAQDLGGELTVEELADDLSRLADIMAEATLREVWLSMPKRHRENPKFAIIAYGKLGGKELGYASDLDIIFLYDDDDQAAPMLYARLAQRFITWMTSPTSAGTLFDIDIALRPDGASGLLVSSFNSFERYQEKSAWPWEHQALTRARFCCGDASIGERFEALRNRILRQRRDPEKLKAEIIKMRKRIFDAHPNRSSLFDIKHDAGGMMDIEFIVQYLVLEYSFKYPELTGNLGNIALLKMSEKLGLFTQVSGETVAAIYRHFRRLQHEIRMQGANEAKIALGSVEGEAEEVKKLWKEIFGKEYTH
ncbi:MAG: bifunctional [glutamate--ammonia ligase]-adenylyl-L-tyrosine phosphorylase/[glutamate--ammonia-ligase] adenylyltransferase [Oxalobacter sp.]